MDEEQDIRETLEVCRQSIQGLVDNQLMLAAQVHVLQAALATVLLHHPTARRCCAPSRAMKISKESTPQLARRMEALEGGMLALLGRIRSLRRSSSCAQRWGSCAHRQPTGWTSHGRGTFAAP